MEIRADNLSSDEMDSIQEKDEYTHGVAAVDRRLYREDMRLNNVYHGNDTARCPMWSGCKEW